MIQMFHLFCGKNWCTFFFWKYLVLYWCKSCSSVAREGAGVGYSPPPPIGLSTKIINYAGGFICRDITLNEALDLLEDVNDACDLYIEPPDVAELTDEDSGD